MLCSMPWAPAEVLVVDDEQLAELRRLVRAPRTPQKLVLRARIVLAATAGESNNAIASELGVSRPTVILWRTRMAEHGLEGILADATRPGRRKAIPAEVVARVVDATLNSRPAGGSHWSIREMAAAQHVSPAAVQRIWKAHGLKPHLVEHFKLSSDPLFAEKVRDIVGLYLKPPDKALVLCVDEKTQIQAIDRTRPVLLLRPGIPERQTHDYTRHGTTSLYAALNVLSGQIIGRCLPRHTHVEFLAFLKLDRSLHAAALRPAPDRRQLLDALDAGGQGVARGPQALRVALHTHQLLLAEPGRTLLRRAHAAAPQARHLRQRPGADRRHRGTHRTAQRPPQAIRVARLCRWHPGQGVAL